jgi:hypothetical protein
MNTKQLVLAGKKWNRTLSDGHLTYIPKNISSEQKFSFTAYPIEPLNQKDIHEWLLSKITAIHKSLGKADNEWKIKIEKDGSPSTSNSFINHDGEKLSVGYNGVPVQNDAAFILQMVSTKDFMLLLRYGMSYYKIIEDAKSTFCHGEG